MATQTPTLLSQAQAPAGEVLSAEQIRQALQPLRGRFAGQRLLVLIPDHTRTLPLPQLFRMLVDVLDDVKTLDFMVALGTHPPLDEAQMLKLVGLSVEERHTIFRHVGLHNHAWQDPDALATVGVVPQAKVREIAGERWHPTLGGDVQVRLNKAALEADHLLILGPTFPHEVVGFSGGAKYLFPGISGPEMINVTHWLGALATVRGTIGLKDTPVRALIHEAARHVPTPITLIALVVQGSGLGGMFVGDHVSAWSAAADLSSTRHIVWVDKPFKRILSCAPPMYDELWTAGKAMYKLDPALADGGELIIYAPHLETVSQVHGKYIYEIGYHTVPYFLNQWERFKHVPLGVLAHSTHVRGSGTWVNGQEHPRVRVTLASRIGPEDCKRLNLGYLDPDSLNPEDFAGREEEGILLVRKAGETLYRVRGKS
ncbi:MAG: lactate racemase domain-containing protein [Meiothermus sp.]|uniref:lactate racemase domain-containing protein n=1 Tax=Meiothermus sp. TaxID=1955249 RepID=UPI0025F44790|nr:lactate racemase domain-containing protein [Meiothermus sp.]MCS7067649.1 lactate racemase domain-containing protein [Meiothermus sp.]